MVNRSCSGHRYKQKAGPLEAPLIMHVDADWRKLLYLQNLEYNGAVRRLSRDFITHPGA